MTSAVFVDKQAAKEYECPICLDPMAQPVECSGGHLFCKGCIDKLIESIPSQRLKCPVCGTKFGGNSRSNPIQYIQRKINDLKVECPHHFSLNTVNNNNTECCDWNGRYGDFDEHINQCPFGLVLCWYSRKGCKEKIRRKDETKHFRQCPYAPMACPQCNGIITRGDLECHLSNQCEMKMTKCQQCGDEMIQKYVSKHIEKECEETWIKCKYRKYGCCDRMKRKEIKKHNKESMERHLELIETDHNNLKEKLIELNNNDHGGRKRKRQEMDEYDPITAPAQKRRKLENANNSLNLMVDFMSDMIPKMMAMIQPNVTVQPGANYINNIESGAIGSGSYFGGNHHHYAAKQEASSSETNEDDDI